MNNEIKTKYKQDTIFLVQAPMLIFDQTDLARFLNILTQIHSFSIKIQYK